MAYTTRDQLGPINTLDEIINEDGTTPRPFAGDLALVTNEDGFHRMREVSAIFDGSSVPVAIWIGQKSNATGIHADNFDPAFTTVHVALACPPFIEEFREFTAEEAVDTLGG